MGIINITPDSFFPGSRQQSIDAVLALAEQHLSEGAVILDIGGQSTRPGSELVSENEELERVGEVIREINKQFPQAYISIDTFYSSVASHAVNNGACIVNDISGGTMDAAMFETVSQLHVPYVCMHIKGTPQTMQQFTQYDDVTKEVLDFFIERIDACKKAGINDVIIDPGFGFAKTTAQNFELLKNLSLLKILDKPLLAGVSRKGMIYRTLGITADEALNGTTVLNTISLLNGANILRVHDVKEAMEVVRLIENGELIINKK